MSFTIKECVIAIEGLLDKEEAISFSGKPEDDSSILDEIEKYLGHMEENVDRWHHFIKTDKSLELEIESDDILEIQYQHAKDILFQNGASKIREFISSIRKPSLGECQDKTQSIALYLQTISESLDQIDHYFTGDKGKLSKSLHRADHASIKKKIDDMKSKLYTSTFVRSIAQELQLITICMNHINNLIEASRYQLITIRSILSAAKKNGKDQEKIDHYIQLQLIQIKKLVQQIYNTLDITGPAAKRIHAQVKVALIIPTLSYIAGLVDALSLKEIGPIYNLN